MTELEIHREPTTFGQQIEQAKALAAGSMLPGEYRNQPANVLIAMNLGQAMGLSPAESLYRIAVIKGKPTASAELIASNVRKAGHRLRVVVDEAAVSATATIVRADDPEFEFAVTRDMKWAQSMGLASNDNYRKQAPTMLANRAITAVARLACPETLYGVAYSADEMTEAFDAPATRSGLASVLEPDPEVTAEVAQIADEPEVHDAEIVPDESLLLNPNSKLAKAMYAALREHGIDKAGARALYEQVTARSVASSKELTEDEARAVLREFDGMTKPEDGPA